MNVGEVSVNDINIEISEKLVKSAVDSLNNTGFYCLEDVIGRDLQEKFSGEVFKLLEHKGKRYFSLINPILDKDLAFKALGEHSKLNSFLIRVAESPLKRKVTTKDSLSVLRVVTGKNSEGQSLKFHYDAYSLTALIPIVIPEGPSKKSGHLVTFKNLRKFRTSFIVNIIEKSFLQNPFMRKILSKVVLANLQKYMYVMKPGNIYLFWGYRSLHANLPVDPSYTRATLLFHFGDVHPRSIANNFIKTSRHAAEKINEKIN